MTMAKMISRPVEVLLVEDNPGDELLTQRAFAASSWDTRVSVERDGRAALAYLRDPARETPDLIVLDVNLPDITGHDVLRAIRDDDVLTGAPVVMFSGSTSRSDVAASYRGHANCHVGKPADLDDYGRAVRAIEEFWLTTAELPRP
jgi:CheY-like chemotaxis protein